MPKGHKWMGECKNKLFLLQSKPLKAIFCNLGPKGLR